jgi:hypothetical protein
MDAAQLLASGSISNRAWATTASGGCPYRMYSYSPASWLKDGPAAMST